MLTPLLAKCRERWPHADIVMTCPTALLGLYAGRPYGVRALGYDPRVPGTLRALFAESGYDLAFVPGDNRYSWLAQALGARWTVAFAGDSPAYKNWPIDELRSYPDARAAWGDLVAALVDGPAPHPYRNGDWPAPFARPFEIPGAPYAVLHLGAGSPLRHWPADRWRAVALRLEARGIAVALSVGPNEATLLDHVGGPSTWSRYPCTLDLAQLWHLLAGARMLICPDTGVAHLARVVGTPTVALFGPGSAALYGGGAFWSRSPFTALTIRDFPCRDQRTVMKRNIPWIRDCKRFIGNGPGRCDEARCMHALTTELVWAEIERRMASIPDGTTPMRP